MREIDYFKEERAYIQAADELQAADSLLANAKRATFTSRKVGTCVAYWKEISNRAANAAENVESIARLITENTDGSRHTYECLQDTSRPISKQIPFDEDVLARLAVIENNVLTCPVSKDFTLWEYLSTLQKRLLQRLVGHPQWYFVRLELEVTAPWWAPEAQPEFMTLHYRQQKGPLYLSDVLLNGCMVGEIGYAKR